MKDYSVTSPNLTGTFPNLTAKNSSGAGLTDGTPYVADYINDEWGFWQDLMNRAGLTPNGTVEASGSSQKRTAFQLQYGAPGELVFTMNPNDPITGKRILLLTGQVILAANYPDLCNAVYVGDGNNPTAPAFYYTSDAGGTARSTVSKTYMVMPDARGISIQGANTNVKITAANGSGYAGGSSLGAMLTDLVQGHKHGISAGQGSHTHTDSGHVHTIHGVNGTGVGNATLANGATVNNTDATTVSGAANIQAATLPSMSADSITGDGTNGTPRNGAYTRSPALITAIGIRY